MLWPFFFLSLRTSPPRCSRACLYMSDCVLPGPIGPWTPPCAASTYAVCTVHLVPFFHAMDQIACAPPPTPTSLARTLARQDDTLSPPPAEPQRRYTLYTLTLCSTRCYATLMVWRERRVCGWKTAAATEPAARSPSNTHAQGWLALAGETEYLILRSGGVKIRWGWGRGEGEGGRSPPQKAPRSASSTREISFPVNAA